MARALKLLRSTMSGDADWGDIEVGCGFVMDGVLGWVDGEAKGVVAVVLKCLSEGLELVQCVASAQSIRREIKNVEDLFVEVVFVVKNAIGDAVLCVANNMKIEVVAQVLLMKLSGDMAVMHVGGVCLVKVLANAGRRLLWLPLSMKLSPVVDVVLYSGVAPGLGVFLQLLRLLIRKADCGLSSTAMGLDNLGDGVLTGAAAEVVVCCWWQVMETGVVVFCLLLSWVGDGWDGALTMCKGDSVEVDFVMIEPGKKLGGKHCLGYVLGKNGEDFVSMAEVRWSGTVVAEALDLSATPVLADVAVAVVWVSETPVIAMPECQDDSSSESMDLQAKLQRSAVVTHHYQALHMEMARVGAPAELIGGEAVNGGVATDFTDPLDVVAAEVEVAEQKNAGMAAVVAEGSAVESTAVAAGRSDAVLAAVVAVAALVADVAAVAAENLEGESAAVAVVALPVPAVVAVATMAADVAAVAAENSEAESASVAVAALPVPVAARGRTHVSMVLPGGKPVSGAGPLGETASRALATH
ncbi:hypothetical protein AK812_SmicGene32091 [Symbiodinium microadriaticum]|uniref:Uncharacterized protein n=1 Tax=Symbiodinium microadriaticum TaxID=2951 RepID=A0A1Q9CV26_SYMMI|nr:hypothetical protein AK812_SmicGene32091 [Symbiodinium microadriaticum]